MYTSTATNKILPIFFGEYYEKKEVPVQTRINYYTHGSVMPGRNYINSLSYRYDYQGQEKDAETGFNNFDLRMYDARYARWFNVDPMAQHHSPYLAMSNNPISYIDPTGGWSFGYGDYHMDKDNGPVEPWDMHSTIDYSIDIGEGINPADWMQNGKAWNYMSRADRIAMQNANGTSYEAQHYNKVRMLAELSGYRTKMGGYNGIIKYRKNGDLIFVPGEEYNNAGYLWHAEFKDGSSKTGQYIIEVKGPTVLEKACGDCLDRSSVGKNYFGLSYPGPNNPLTMKGKYSYSHVPSNSAEYPAIGHDRRYDRLEITGGAGLFFDPRAIGADLQFVKEEMKIAVNPLLNPVDRLTAGTLGAFVGLFALPKMLITLSTPFGYSESMMWYNYSNIGVNNKPNIHKH